LEFQLLEQSLSKFKINLKCQHLKTAVEWVMEAEVMEAEVMEVMAVITGAIMVEAGKTMEIMVVDAVGSMGRAEIMAADNRVDGEDQKDQGNHFLRCQSHLHDQETEDIIRTQEMVE
jgi:hypothetical protein